MHRFKDLNSAARFCRALLPVSTTDQSCDRQERDLVAFAQRDQHLAVFLDEAHIHQDCDLGYNWAERGQRLWIASRSPGLSARVSFYGLYLYNEGQVRLWPYRRANGE